MSTEAELKSAAEHLRELGIDPGETYDGPNPDNVTQFPANAGAVGVYPPDYKPGGMLVGLAPPVPIDSKAGVLDTLTAALQVLSARLLGMIAVIGAVLMFGWAVYDPQPWRLAAVGTYAAVVLWPIVFLYLKRG